MARRTSDLLEGAPIALSWLLLAFVGAWVGHTAEYLRVDGSRGVGTELAGTVHLYMGPLGVVLFALLGVVALRWHREGRHLDVRLRAGQAVLRGRRRPAQPDQADPDRLPAPSSLGHEWGFLLAGQLVIYFVQENIESLRAAGHAPGLGVLSGVHWAAPLIHAIVALVLAAALVVLRRRRARLLGTLSVVEGLVARLWPVRTPRLLAGPAEAVVTPHQRWGRQRWQRPPPVGRLVGGTVLY